MPFRWAHAKSTRKRSKKLRGQCDLREQHQRLAIFTHSFGDRFEIDLGLA